MCLDCLFQRGTERGLWKARYRPVAHRSVRWFLHAITDSDDGHIKPWWKASTNNRWLCDYNCPQRTLGSLKTSDNLEGYPDIVELPSLTTETFAFSPPELRARPARNLGNLKLTFTVGGDSNHTITRKQYKLPVIHAKLIMDTIGAGRLKQNWLNRQAAGYHSARNNVLSAELIS